jgi:hypothetical protein
VAAHPEIADVIEEDHTGRVLVVDRLTQERAYHRVMPARFANDGAPKVVVVTSESIETFFNRSVTEIRKT